MTTPVIKYDPNPAGRAFLRAVEQDDRQTLEQLIDHGIEMDGFPLELIVPKLNPEKLAEIKQLLVDRGLVQP